MFEISKIDLRLCHLKLEKNIFLATYFISVSDIIVALHFNILFFFYYTFIYVLVNLKSKDPIHIPL